MQCVTLSVVLADEGEAEATDYLIAGARKESSITPIAPNLLNTWKL